MLTLDADLSMLDLGTGTEFRMGILRLVFPGESWCSSARDATAWFYQPLCITEEATSVAVAIITSNGEGCIIIATRKNRNSIQHQPLPHTLLQQLRRRS